jgi:hypothetical protein
MAIAWTEDQVVGSNKMAKCSHFHTKWNYVHCLVSFSNRGHRPEGINYLLLGMKMGPPINDCHNSVASHGIAISGIHSFIVAHSGEKFIIYAYCR